MTIYQGVAISGSVFIGKAKIYKQKEIHIANTVIESSQIESELQLLKDGIKQLESDINSYLADPQISQIDKDILGTHLMIVTDIEIVKILELAVSRDLMSAPQAVFASFEKIIHHFENMDNNYYAQRAEDYKDVAHNLLKQLLGEGDEQDLSYQLDDIIFLKEITPSLVSRFASKKVRAYCVEHGSFTSHSSILSRALGLTAIVSNNEITKDITSGTQVIISAQDNLIIVNPNEAQLNEFRQKLAQIKEDNRLLSSTLSLQSITKNHIEISIKANLEYPGEIQGVIDNNCNGIGLFRTEFLYLNRQTLPDEDYQTKVYSDILTSLNGLSVTIRTFDLGGDKISHLQQSKREDNPYLGCRGIRFSLQQIPIFKTQIRAILKASVDGKANIMFPMIVGVEDFRQAKAIVDVCKEELLQEGIEFDKDIPIGVMIETPSAALCSAQLAKECDFFSLGTNDLVQYTLATDRNNDNVASYYIQHHPAVLKLIQQTVTAAGQAGIPISICGEMASELMYVPLLVGMGIEDLSINPAQTLPVKAVIRNCDEELFRFIRNFDFNTDISAIEHLLKVTLKPYYTIQS